MNDMLIWIDCEMTGLDLDNDELVEVAAIVTDGQLNCLDEGVSVVIKPSDTALAGMGEFVRTMHEDSGLLPELAGGTSVEAAEQLVLDYIKKHVPDAGKTPLAGNTVGTDRAFLAAQMPELEGHLHYRNVDVSTIKELAKRWIPRIFFNTPEKNGNHRALADIQESIEELRYYREVFFVQDGLPSKRLREIAAHHAGQITGITGGDSQQEDA